MNYIHAFIHIIFILVMYLGLPMVGWGVGDIKGFYSQPARLGYALLIGIAAVQAAYQGLVIPEERGQAEKMLHLEFGEGWEIYIRHTWRLLPYIILEGGGGVWNRCWQFLPKGCLNLMEVYAP